MRDHAKNTTDHTEQTPLIPDAKYTPLDFPFDSIGDKM